MTMLKNSSAHRQNSFRKPLDSHSQLTLSLDRKGIRTTFALVLAAGLMVNALPVASRPIRAAAATMAHHLELRKDLKPAPVFEPERVANQSTNSRSATIRQPMQSGSQMQSS